MSYNPAWTATRIKNAEQRILESRGYNESTITGKEFEFLYGRVKSASVHELTRNFYDGDAFDSCEFPSLRALIMDEIYVECGQ